ncbi:MAG: stealth conserved region 3 domain-containing protein [Sporichthyaceae bacterium]
MGGDSASGRSATWRHSLALARRLGPRGVLGELRAQLPGAAPRRLPLAHDGLKVDFEIDVVYTWVNGADPTWQARRDAAWAKANPHEHSNLAANPSRYLDRAELRYSLRSLERNAPWVRHIYVVTDHQVPAWLNPADPRLRIVDHTEIFTDSGALPTFNSHAIESRLHRIPGLAEHYLYLNDDMFFGAPCAPEDFFVGNGLARLFPSPKSLPHGPVSTTDTPVEAAGKNNRALLDKHFGRTLSHRFLHAPYPQLRSVVTEMESAFGADFARTAASSFRHPSDISIPASLVGNYAYLSARAVPGSLTYAYVDLADPRLGRRLRAIRAQHPQVFCLNDHAGLGADPGAVTRAVTSFLAGYFPEPSSFERAHERQRP